MLVSFAKGHEYKNGYVMWPVRTAVSGKQMTPGGATELMELLGKVGHQAEEHQIILGGVRKITRGAVVTRE